MKKKYILFLLVIFLFPISVFASDGEPDKYYVNIDILKNGDIKVKELVSLEGEYNGRFRDIIFKDSSLSTFDGSKESFQGSDIYNGSSIKDIVVSEVSNKDSISFSDINSSEIKDNIYTEVSSASPGDKRVYTKDEYTGSVKFKIFNPSSTNTAFYLEYTITDVVVVHKDVAEIAWKIFSDTFEDDIENLEIRVNLPGEDSDIRVWLHGPLDGTIERVDGKYALIKYPRLYAHNYISTRVMFDKDLVSDATKMSNVDGKDQIIEVETEWADEANAIRERVRKQNAFIRIVTIISLIISTVLFIILLIKHKNNKKSSFNQDYLRDFPEDYGPEILEYLMKKSVSTESMGASILMIIEKKALKIEQDPQKKKEYNLVKQEEFVKDLTDHEAELLGIIIDFVGDGKSVSLKQIKNYGSSVSKAEKFMKKYDHWKNAIEKEAKTYKFFISCGFKVPVCISSLISIALAFICFMMEASFIVSFVTAVLAVIFFIITLCLKFRSSEGALQYSKWMALKKFMLDFGAMDIKELPELSIWGKYLVYATILGCAKELEKAMKIRIKDIDTTKYGADPYYWYYYNNNYFVTREINNAMSKAVSISRSSIAASQSSSGSGFGGGASSGGGSFGGGGGGGHF